MKLRRRRDHSPKGLSKVGRARAAGAGDRGVAWSTKIKRCVPEQNERFGLHDNIETDFIFPWILDTKWGPSCRVGRLVVRVLSCPYACWGAGVLVSARLLKCSSVHRALVLAFICSSCSIAHEHGRESNFSNNTNSQPSTL